MGACATKPKVLGDKVRRQRSRRHRPSSKANESPSSLKDEKGSISFSNKDRDIIKDEFSDDHYVHHDELPLYDDDDDIDTHDPSIKDEAANITSAIAKAIEQSKNDVVEEPKLKEDELITISDPIPTKELLHHHKADDKSAADASHATIPAGFQPQNDVVERETPVHDADTENDVVVETVTPAGVVSLEISPPPPSYKSKNVVIASALCHHSGKDLTLDEQPIGIGMGGPTQSNSVAHEDDDVITTNMPSTFAF
ncbi:hypothetical protein V2J09_012667 [Rumex salicifolius]